MNTYWVRFLGDPRGYRITTRLSETELVALGWLRVFVGITDQTAMVDAAKAYLIETEAT